MKKSKKKDLVEIAVQAVTAEMNARVESLARQLEEERKKFGDMVQLRMEKTRLDHQLEVLRLITDGKKEEAIASVLRKDVMLFGMEVRFADETLEKARQEWYEKGWQAALESFSGWFNEHNCTLTARPGKGQEKQESGKDKKDQGVRS